MKRIIFSTFLSLIFITSFAQQNPNETMNSQFYQGLVKVSDSFQDCSNDHNLGNCVTIALIKAALAEFRTPDNIFKSISTKDNESEIVFLDGDRVTVNQADLQTVEELAGIRHITDAVFYDQALLLYASICKKVLLHKDEYNKLMSTRRNQKTCISSFENAVEYINSGYSTSDAYELLALKKLPVKIEDLSNTNAAIIWSHYHAVFCTNGLQDYFGTLKEVKNGVMRNARGKSSIKGAYKLTK